MVGILVMNMARRVIIDFVGEFVMSLKRLEIDTKDVEESYEEDEGGRIRNRWCDREDCRL